MKGIPYMVQMGAHLFGANLTEADRTRLLAHLSAQLNQQPDARFAQDSMENVSLSDPFASSCG